jgi:ABC-2 type transport system permease protein
MTDFGTALEPPKKANSQQLAVGILTSILIYMALLLNGQAVAPGVVEEKTSRVVEILLGAVRPWQLMVGKVLGPGLAGGGVAGRHGGGDPAAARGPHLSQRGAAQRRAGPAARRLAGELM